MRYFPGSARYLLFVSIPVLIFSMPVQTAAQRPGRGASVRVPQVTSPGVRFTSGQSALKIPFEVSSNIILVQSQVNDSRPLWFIFDTGANSSVINAPMVKELNLQTRGKVGGSGSGGKIEAELITGVTLSVPGVAVSNQTIASLPLDVFSMVLGKRVGGIIGYDFIRQFVVEIDYAAKVMNLYSQRVSIARSPVSLFPSNSSTKSLLSTPRSSWKDAMRSKTCL